MWSPKARFAAAECDAPLQPLSNLKMRRSVNAVDALMISENTVATQEYMQASVTEAPALRGKFLKALFQGVIVRPLQHSAKRLRMARRDVTSSALAKPDLFNYRLSSSSPLLTRQKFPEAISLSASISSAESARSRFSRRFSSSSARIFATSLTSMPPNFDFQA